MTYPSLTDVVLRLKVPSRRAAEWHRRNEAGRTGRTTKTTTTTTMIMTMTTMKMTMEIETMAFDRAAAQAAAPPL
jgi:hypothetical protein